MKIAVISDTHIPGKAKKLPAVLLEDIRGVDFIIHAGDISRDYVICELEEIAPVYAVAGNNDEALLWDRLGRKKTITADRCRIGIIHGDGPSGTTLRRVKKAFEGEDVACVVFGHSHIPLHESIDGVLYFNPGSPTDRRRQKQFSYGILTVEGERIAGEIRYFV